MKNAYYDIAIIGGGASGLMLAANLDLMGAPGIVLEGSRVLGSKLLMSGGGRCNITHGGSIKDFINAYGEAGPVMRKCLYRHSNLGLMKWFEDRGLELKDEDGRVFPASGRAMDVLDTLLDEAASNLWQIGSGAKVTGLREADGLWDITLDGGYIIRARNAVIAAGGITYPETGSDGSMLGILKDLGIEITDPRPALAPVYAEDYPYADLAGISLKDVSVTAFSSDAAHTCKGKAARMTGDILFMHDGFSGPAVLNISRYAEPGEKIRFSYNKELRELPKRMQKALQDRARGDSGDIKTTVLAALLDHDDFTVKAVDKRGMVTAGGVLLDEVDMSTMRVKRYGGRGEESPAGPALYVIGEALDADGITGGYNLQMCWSTACTCAEDLKGIQ